MRRIINNSRDEFGRFCFEAWRYRSDGSENPDFPLNQPRFRQAKILVAGDNFGCGSLGAPGNGHPLRDRAELRRYFLQ
jgi:3-isopropylmalate/(R)-2-methylmalate dehydratase small subunit